MRENKDQKKLRIWILFTQRKLTNNSKYVYMPQNQEIPLEESLAESFFLHGTPKCLKICRKRFEIRTQGKNDMV